MDFQSKGLNHGTMGRIRGVSARPVNGGPAINHGPPRARPGHRADYCRCRPRVKGQRADKARPPLPRRASFQYRIAGENRRSLSRWLEDPGHPEAVAARQISLDADETPS
jgi:hypothetical protein